MEQSVAKVEIQNGTNIGYTLTDFLLSNTNMPYGRLAGFVHSCGNKVDPFHLEIAKWVQPCILSCLTYQK